MNDIMKQLQEPFPASEIEWRVQSCGVSNGRPWVMVLAYIQARAIQRRLDDIFGWNGWTEEYRNVGDSMICRLGLHDGEKWVYKENGASNTDIEAFKGGISGAFKRVAASGFGIGRYLYNLEECYADCQTDKPSPSKGWETARTKDKQTIYWKIPQLPAWALPEGEKQEPRKQEQPPQKINDIQAKAIKDRLTNLNKLDYVLQGYKLEKVEDMAIDMLSKINEWCNKQEAKAV